MRLRLLIASLALLWSASAFADKVPPPPESCPTGSVGRTDGGGARCTALDCKLDADCDGGLVCREFSLCIEEMEVAPRKRPGSSEEEVPTPSLIFPPTLYAFVRGTCETPSSCKKPALCTAGKRCVKPSVAATKTPLAPTAATKTSEPTTSTTTSTETPAPSTTTPPAAKGCVVSPGGSVDGLWWVLLSLGLLWRQRRWS